jgi:hypothetical protein
LTDEKESKGKDKKKVHLGTEEKEEDRKIKEDEIGEVKRKEYKSKEEGK